jgi:hypothetical protein
MDATALRTGAIGSNDEFAPITPDIEAGIAFLSELRQHCERLIVFDGNHEARIYRIAASPKAILAEIGYGLVKRINCAMQELRADHVRYDGLWACRSLGGYRLMHGIGTGGINALRQHVMAYGSCIIAHTHAAHLECGLRADGAIGISVGTLADIRKLEYAHNRLNTLRWSAGFAWGEFSGERGIFWLHRQPVGVPWVLPF